MIYDIFKYKKYLVHFYLYAIDVINIVVKYTLAFKVYDQMSNHMRLEITFQCLSQLSFPLNNV